RVADQFEHGLADRHAELPGSPGLWGIGGRSRKQRRAAPADEEAAAARVEAQRRWSKRRVSRSLAASFSRFICARVVSSTARTPSSASRTCLSSCLWRW